MLLTACIQVKPELPAEKQTTLGLYLTAKEALTLKANHLETVLFVDIRTPQELQLTGYPVLIDDNIPFVFFDYTQFSPKTGFKVVENKLFLPSIEQLVLTYPLKKDTSIILMSQNGVLSAQAVNLLANNGFTHVWSITDGFEGKQYTISPLDGDGWKNSHLPWTYFLEQDKVWVK